MTCKHGINKGVKRCKKGVNIAILFFGLGLKKHQPQLLSRRIGMKNIVISKIANDDTSKFQSKRRPVLWRRFFISM